SWAVVLASVGVAFAPKPWQIGAIGAALVFLIVPLTVVLETYELRVVPESLLGRVLSARQFAVSSLLWTATPVAGVLADAFGAGPAVLVLAGCFAVTALWTTTSRAVRLVDEDPDPVPVDSAHSAVPVDSADPDGAADPLPPAAAGPG